MSQFFAADLIVPVSGKPIPGGCIETADDGTILSISNSPAPQTAVHLKGVLIPGFVNSHCHLELSHLRGRISEKTGMATFIRELLSKRFAVSEEEQHVAMIKAEEEMISNGIVAVGDISNTPNSSSVKEKNKLYYHTFVEVLGLNPKQATEIVEKGLLLRENFTEKNDHSSTIVPHAPYSVSELLFQQLTMLPDNQINPFSIHMEESADENIFCRTGGGPLADFYKSFGIDFSAFIPAAESTPIEKVIPFLTSTGKKMFVHNTFLTAEEAGSTEQFFHDVFWCLCPNANLFISDRLPDFSVFNHAVRKVTIGTDSLASNHQLCILSELKTITHAAPEISFDTLLKWSTLNGADFLGISSRFGHLTPGARPGLVLLENCNPSDPKILDETRCCRIL